jgi:hypothetical protein
MDDSVRVAETTPLRVVEMVPKRLPEVVSVMVVDIVPVLVVEMTPDLVVEMTPLLAKAGACNAVSKTPVQIMDTRFFIFSSGSKMSGIQARVSFLQSNSKPTVNNNCFVRYYFKHCANGISQLRTPFKW